MLRDVAGTPLAVAGTLESGEYWIRFPGLATFAFHPGGQEALVTAAPATSRSVVEDLFRTAALPLMLQAAGYEALHASAVQMPGGVVAFCGFSGAGKTTVAYGFARRGHALWTDDVLIFSLNESRDVVAHPRLSDTINLRPRSQRFFGLEPDSPSATSFATAKNRRLAAIVALSTETGTSRDDDVQPIDAALTMLLPHAFCFFALDGRKQTTVTAYLDLVARVPVFQFERPKDFVHFEAALDGLESRLLQTIAGT